MAAFMIQSVGEEQKRIDRNFKLIEVTVHHQGSLAGAKQSSNPPVILEAGQGLAQLAHRTLCHGPEITATLPARPACLHGSSPSSARGPRVTVLPSLRSLVLVAVPRCLGSAPGCPGRKDTAYAVVPLSCSLALLLLLLGTIAGAVSSSISSRTWVIHQTWLLQAVGTRSLGL